MKYRECQVILMNHLTDIEMNENFDEKLMSLLGIEPMEFTLEYLGNGTFPDLTDVTTRFCAKCWPGGYRNWKRLFL